MITIRIGKMCMISVLCTLAAVFTGHSIASAEGFDFKKDETPRAIQEIIKEDVDILLTNLSIAVKNIDIDDLEVTVDAEEYDLELFKSNFQKYAQAITERIYKNGFILNSVESLLLKNNDKLLYSKHAEFLRSELLEDLTLAKNTLNSDLFADLIILKYGKFDSDTHKLIVSKRFSKKRKALIYLIKNSFSYRERIIKTYIEIVSSKTKQ